MADPDRWARHPVFPDEVRERLLADRVPTEPLRLPDAQQQQPTWTVGPRRAPDDHPTTLEYVSRVQAIVKVTDGDTYWLLLRLPFRHQSTECIRLAGYDCPERTKGSAREKAEAKRATQVALDFLWGALSTDGVTLWVRTEPDPDNFGRWLGDVWRETSDGQKRHLGAELRSFGLASLWPTRWRDEYDG